MISLSIKHQQEKTDISNLEVYLECGENNVYIKATGLDGDEDYYLLIIHPDGTFERCTGLPLDIGLQLDGINAIKESKNG